MKYIVQPVFAGHAHMPGVTANKTYTIASAKSGKVASVRRGAIQLEQESWKENRRQQWKIEPLSPDNTGQGEVYATDGQGNITPLEIHRCWRKTWDLIIPGRFGGSQFTDLLFYDRRARVAEFYTTDRQGKVTRLKKHKRWRKTWDLIIPGRFGGSKFTDLLCYDREAGEVAFYTTDGRGKVTLLKKHKGWRKTWDLIIPGHFSDGEFTDLLFYDRGLSEGLFYTTDGQGNIFPTGFGFCFAEAITITAVRGNIAPLNTHQGWRKTWDLIIPGHFSDGEFTDLLFYDRGAGEGEFYTTDGQGNITLLRRHPDWRKTWDLIVPGQFGGSEFTDLLFYDRGAGEGELCTTDGQGNITPLKTHPDWRKTWNMIVPGQFGGDDFTGLLFYTTAGSSGIFRIVSAKTGKVLLVSKGSMEDGAEIIERDWRGGRRQQWIMEHLGSGRFKIISRNSGKVLDVLGGSTEQGAPIVQWSWHGGLSQQWQLSTITNLKIDRAYDARATIYEHGNYQGRSQVIGAGSYDMAELSIGNDTLSSLKVPDGLQVTLYEHANFRGRTKKFVSDTPWVGDDFNDLVSAVSVEMVATIYSERMYQGKSQHLGVGMYNVDDLTIGDDTLSSLKVPQGMMVTLFEHADFKGRLRVFTENTPWVGGDFNDITSGIAVKVMGIVIPNGALKYGDKVILRSHHGKYLAAEADGRLTVNRDTIEPLEEFVITRSGDSKHTSYVSYGDTISLHSCHKRYVAAGPDGQVVANSSSIGSDERFTIVRSGDTLHNSFVTIGDTISFRSTHDRYLAADADDNVRANQTEIDAEAKWVIRTEEAESGTVGACGAQVCGEAVGTSYCGAQAAGVAVCGLEACGADACGAAACNAAATLVGACGAAASNVAICGADLGGATACYAELEGADVCGAAACGAAACGADACGAAGCAAAGCAAAACGAAGCVSKACSTDASLVEGSVAEACAAEAGVVDACPFDACGANVCGINLCPADACGADACPVDVIPIVPGI